MSGVKHSVQQLQGIMEYQGVISLSTSNVENLLIRMWIEQKTNNPVDASFSVLNF